MSARGGAASAKAPSTRYLAGGESASAWHEPRRTGTPRQTSHRTIPMKGARRRRGSADAAPKNKPAIQGASKMGQPLRPARGGAASAGARGSRLSIASAPAPAWHEPRRATTTW